VELAKKVSMLIRVKGVRNVWSIALPAKMKINVWLAIQVTILMEMGMHVSNA